MKSILRRAREVRRERGTLALLKRAIPGLYNRLVWPSLPRTRPRKLNGVPIATEHHRWFETIVPWRTPACDRPSYEDPLVSGLRSQVESGDDVVIVGGGHGITAVVAAELTGEQGAVLVFEGSDERIDSIRGTLRLNDMADRVTLRHGIVGTDQDYKETVYGESTASVVSPGDLPQCDILELDCEGAESEILRDLQIEPRVILVETHGFLESPTDAVAERLHRRGYDIVARGAENPDRDVYVLTARSNGPAG